MTSDLTTTAKYSESDKKANFLISIDNKCTHFSFSLVVLMPADWLQNQDQDSEGDDAEEEPEPKFS